MKRIKQKEGKPVRGTLSTVELWGLSTQDPLKSWKECTSELSAREQKKSFLSNWPSSLTGPVMDIIGRGPSGPSGFQVWACTRPILPLQEPWCTKQDRKGEKCPVWSFFQTAMALGKGGLRRCEAGDRRHPTQVTESQGLIVFNL